MEQALSDIKVLDLTHFIAGPYCTELLADFGAEVVKVEKPGEGDGARVIGPFLKYDPHPERSGLFLYLNTNKKGITLNLKTETGRNIFKQLVKWADILVENFHPRVMPGLGLEYEVLSQVNPQLVMTSISNFGQTGPYRDYRASELILYGMGGAMNVTGSAEREPLKLGGTVVQYQAGVVAAVGTMGALFTSQFQGIGQHIDVSIMETQLGTPDRRSTNLLSYAYSGSIPFFRAERLGMLILPHGRYSCLDGFMEYGGAQPTFWPRWVKMLDMPELLTDPRFSRLEDLYNLEHRDEFMVIFLPWLSQRTRQEAMEAAQAAGVPGTAVYTPRDVVEEPHFKERGFFVEIDHPVAGKVKYPGPPFRMEKTPWQVRRPAPLLGEHNEEIYCQLLGHSKEELLRFQEGGIV